jgi:hypothetical protein
MSSGVHESPRPTSMPVRVIVPLWVSWASMERFQVRPTRVHPVAHDTDTGYVRSPSEIEVESTA